MYVQFCNILLFMQVYIYINLREYISIQKSAPVGGVSKLRFLIHMAVIKDQQSALEMLGGRVLTISSIRKASFRDMGKKMEPNVYIYKNGHNWGRKWVPRHESGAIRLEISREKRWDTSRGP